MRLRAAARVVVAVAGVGVIGAGLLAASRLRDRESEEARCSPGFVAIGPRCCAAGIDRAAVPAAENAGGAIDADADRCTSEPPPRRLLLVPETTLVLGPSDWEAEGRVAPRTVHVHAFYMDVLEATVADMACPACSPNGAHAAPHDGARAANGVTREEAERYCAARALRLPTEDEWIAAAAGPDARRYPWGDTGAVCRRAAWGLAGAPCAASARGPDTVGAHHDGRTPDGLEDMAGNVAEWVTTADGHGAARGGSWRTSLAAELRTWAEIRIDPAARDDRVGVRCARSASEGTNAPREIRTN